MVYSPVGVNIWNCETKVKQHWLIKRASISNDSKNDVVKGKSDNNEISPLSGIVRQRQNSIDW